MDCPWQSNFVANKVNSRMDSHCLLRYLDHRSFFSSLSPLHYKKTLSKLTAVTFCLTEENNKKMSCSRFSTVAICTKICKTTDPLQPSYHTDNSELIPALKQIACCDTGPDWQQDQSNWCQRWRSVSQDIQMLPWEEHHWKCHTIGWLGTEETNIVKGQHSLRQKNVREM